MQKFTLPAGTTNRHKWHKEAAGAVAKVAGTFNMLRQIYGQHGGESHESLVSVFSYGLDQPKNAEAVKLYEETGERFSWEITRENADAVRDAFREILPACMESIPVEDNRTTAEEDAERHEKRAQEAQAQKVLADEKADRVEELAAELRKQYPDAEPKGKKSEQARAAANLKRILQARGLQCSVKSSSFSMGDDVTAKVTADLPPDDRKELDEIAERFSYSTFDPMTDSTGFKRDDEGEAWRLVHGSTKYCRIDWRQSDEMRAAIAEFLGDDTADEYGSNAGYRVWTGAHHSAGEFWAKWAEDHAKPEPAEPVQGGGFEIQKHHHTKRGFDFWLVVLADRVERDEFTRLRSSCKAAGGWYSRKWGSTPGGFAFKEREQAGAWAVQEFSGPDSDPEGPPPPPKPKQSTERAGKFREMAEKVAGEVAAKRGDHRENTPKQQREGMSRRIDADRLERTEQALRAMADLFEAGEVPPLLAKFTSKKAIFSALGTRTESRGYYHVADTGEHSDESPEAVALWALIDGKDPEQEQADKLRDLRADVKGRKIPGYFPTPPELAADMVDRLGISGREPWTLLEPSAGCGAILDEVEKLANEPAAAVVYEVNSTLCEILQAKGYDARPRNFMEQEPGAVEFDAVLMNPPFEKFQDVEHVRHAFRFLKPGGRLVAITAPGWTYQDKRKARGFRKWFEELGGEVEDLPAGTFKASGTSVNACLLVIDKPDEVEEVEHFKPEAPGFEISEQPSLF